MARGGRARSGLPALALAVLIIAPSLLRAQQFLGSSEVELTSVINRAQDLQALDNPAEAVFFAGDNVTVEWSAAATEPWTDVVFEVIPVAFNDVRGQAITMGPSITPESGTGSSGFSYSVTVQLRTVTASPRCIFRVGSRVEPRLRAESDPYACYLGTAFAPTLALRGAVTGAPGYSNQAAFALHPLAVVWRPPAPVPASLLGMPTVELVMLAPLQTTTATSSSGLFSLTFRTTTPSTTLNVLPSDRKVVHSFGTLFTPQMPEDTTGLAPGAQAAFAGPSNVTWPIPPVSVVQKACPSLGNLADTLWSMDLAFSPLTGSIPSAACAQLGPGADLAFRVVFPRRPALTFTSPVFNLVPTAPFVLLEPAAPASDTAVVVPRGTMQVGSVLPRTPSASLTLTWAATGEQLFTTTFATTPGLSRLFPYNIPVPPPSSVLCARSLSNNVDVIATMSTTGDLQLTGFGLIRVAAPPMLVAVNATAVVPLDAQPPRGLDGPYPLLYPNDTLAVNLRVCGRRGGAVDLTLVCRPRGAAPLRYPLGRSTDWSGPIRVRLPAGINGTLCNRTASVEAVWTPDAEPGSLTVFPAMTLHSITLPFGFEQFPTPAAAPPLLFISLNGTTAAWGDDGAAAGGLSAVGREGGTVAYTSVLTVKPGDALPITWGGGVGGWRVLFFLPASSLPLPPDPVMTESLEAQGVAPFDGNVTIATAAAPAANASVAVGPFASSVTIPCELAPGAWIAVVSDWSYAVRGTPVFTVASPSLKVTQPAGGEIFTEGQSLRVQWDTDAADVEEPAELGDLSLTLECTPPSEGTPETSSLALGTVGLGQTSLPIASMPFLEACGRGATPSYAISVSLPACRALGPWRSERFAIDYPPERLAVLWSAPGAPGASSVANSGKSPFTWAPGFGAVFPRWEGYLRPGSDLSVALWRAAQGETPAQLIKAVTTITGEAAAAGRGELTFADTEAVAPPAGPPADAEQEVFFRFTSTGTGLSVDSAILRVLPPQADVLAVALPASAAGGPGVVFSDGAVQVRWKATGAAAFCPIRLQILSPSNPAWPGLIVTPVGITGGAEAYSWTLPQAFFPSTADARALMTVSVACTGEPAAMGPGGVRVAPTSFASGTSPVFALRPAVAVTGPTGAVGAWAGASTLVTWVPRPGADADFSLSLVASVPGSAPVTVASGIVPSAGQFLWRFTEAQAASLGVAAGWVPASLSLQVVPVAGADSIPLTFALPLAPPARGVSASGVLGGAAAPGARSFVVSRAQPRLLILSPTHAIEQGKPLLIDAELLMSAPAAGDVAGRRRARRMQAAVGTDGSATVSALSSASPAYPLGTSSLDLPVTVELWRVAVPEGFAGELVAEGAGAARRRLQALIELGGAWEGTNATLAATLASRVPLSSLPFTVSVSHLNLALYCGKSATYLLRVTVADGASNDALVGWSDALVYALPRPTSRVRITSPAPGSLPQLNITVPQSVLAPGAASGDTLLNTTLPSLFGSSAYSLVWTSLAPTPGTAGAGASPCAAEYADAELVLTTERPVDGMLALPPALAGDGSSGVAFASGSSALLLAPSVSLSAASFSAALPELVPAPAGPVWLALLSTDAKARVLGTLGPFAYAPSTISLAGPSNALETGTAESFVGQPLALTYRLTGFAGLEQRLALVQDPLPGSGASGTIVSRLEVPASPAGSGSGSTTVRFSWVPGLGPRVSASASANDTNVPPARVISLRAVDLVSGTSSAPVQVTVAAPSVWLEDRSSAGTTAFACAGSPPVYVPGQFLNVTARMVHTWTRDTWTTVRVALIDASANVSAVALALSMGLDTPAVLSPLSAVPLCAVPRFFNASSVSQAAAVNCSWTIPSVSRGLPAGWSWGRSGYRTLAVEQSTGVYAVSTLNFAIAKARVVFRAPAGLGLQDPLAAGLVLPGATLRSGRGEATVSFCLQGDTSTLPLLTSRDFMVALSSPSVGTTTILNVGSAHRTTAAAAANLPACADGVMWTVNLVVPASLRPDLAASDYSVVIAARGSVAYTSAVTPLACGGPSPAPTYAIASSARISIVGGPSSYSSWNLATLMDPNSRRRTRIPLDVRVPATLVQALADTPNSEIRLVVRCSGMATAGWGWTRNDWFRAYYSRYFWFYWVPSYWWDRWFSSYWFSHNSAIRSDGFRVFQNGLPDGSPGDHIAGTVARLNITALRAAVSQNPAPSSPDRLLLLRDDVSFLTYRVPLDFTANNTWQETINAHNGFCYFSADASHDRLCTGSGTCVEVEASSWGRDWMPLWQRVSTFRMPPAAAGSVVTVTATTKDMLSGARSAFVMTGDEVKVNATVPASAPIWVRRSNFTCEARLSSWRIDAPLQRLGPAHGIKAGTGGALTFSGGVGIVDQRWETENGPVQAKWVQALKEGAALSFRVRDVNMSSSWAYGDSYRLSVCEWPLLDVSPSARLVSRVADPVSSANTLTRPGLPSLVLPVFTVGDRVQIIVYARCLARVRVVAAAYDAVSGQTLDVADLGTFTVNPSATASNIIVTIPASAVTAASSSAAVLRAVALDGSGVEAQTAPVRITAARPSMTPTPTRSTTPSVTPTRTRTPTATPTKSPSRTPSPTRSPSRTPTSSPTPSQTPIASLGCPAGWSRPIGATTGLSPVCYKVIGGSFNRDEAQRACAAQLQGRTSWLASIRNAEELAFADRLTRPFDTLTWIGLNDIAVEGTFVWANPGVSNTFVQPTNPRSPRHSTIWRPLNAGHQPDNYFNEDCVEIWQGRFNDLTCSRRLSRALCETMAAPTPSAVPTASSSATATKSALATASAGTTWSATFSAAATASGVMSQDATPSSSASISASTTADPVATGSAVATASASTSASASASVSGSASGSASGSPSSTAVSTASPSASASASGSATATGSGAPTPSASSSASATASGSSSSSASATGSASSSSSSSASSTASSSASSSASATATATQTPTPSSTGTPTPTQTPTGTPTQTPSPTSTESASPTPSSTVSSSPTPSATSTVSSSSTPLPTPILVAPSVMELQSIPTGTLVPLGQASAPLTWTVDPAVLASDPDATVTVQLFRAIPNVSRGRGAALPITQLVATLASGVPLAARKVTWSLPRNLGDRVPAPAARSAVASGSSGSSAAPPADEAALGSTFFLRLIRESTGDAADSGYFTVVDSAAQTASAAVLRMLNPHAGDAATVGTDLTLALSTRAASPLAPLLPVLLRADTSIDVDEEEAAAFNGNAPVMGYVSVEVVLPAVGATTLDGDEGAAGGRRRSLVRRLQGRPGGQTTTPVTPPAPGGPSTSSPPSTPGAPHSAAPAAAAPSWLVAASLGSFPVSVPLPYRRVESAGQGVGLLEDGPPFYLTVALPADLPPRSDYRLRVQLAGVPESTVVSDPIPFMPAPEPSAAPSPSVTPRPSAGAAAPAEALEVTGPAAGSTCALGGPCSVAWRVLDDAAVGPFLSATLRWVSPFDGQEQELALSGRLPVSAGAATFMLPASAGELGGAEALAGVYHVRLSSLAAPVQVGADGSVAPAGPPIRADSALIRIVAPQDEASAPPRVLDVVSPAGGAQWMVNRAPDAIGASASRPGVDLDGSSTDGGMRVPPLSAAHGAFEVAWSASGWPEGTTLTILLEWRSAAAPTGAADSAALPAEQPPRLAPLARNLPITSLNATLPVPDSVPLLAAGEAGFAPYSYRLQVVASPPGEDPASPVASDSFAINLSPESLTAAGGGHMPEPPTGLPGGASIPRVPSTGVPSGSGSDEAGPGLPATGTEEPPAPGLPADGASAGFPSPNSLPRGSFFQLSVTAPHAGSVFYLPSPPSPFAGSGAAGAEEDEELLAIPVAWQLNTSIALQDLLPGGNLSISLVRLLPNGAAVTLAELGSVPFPPQEAPGGSLPLDLFPGVEAWAMGAVTSGNLTWVPERAVATALPAVGNVVVRALLSTAYAPVRTAAPMQLEIAADSPFLTLALQPTLSLAPFDGPLELTEGDEVTLVWSSGGGLGGSVQIDVMALSEGAAPVLLTPPIATDIALERGTFVWRATTAWGQGVPLLLRLSSTSRPDVSDVASDSLRVVPVPQFVFVTEPSAPATVVLPFSPASGAAAQAPARVAIGWEASSGLSGDVSVELWCEKASPIEGAAPELRLLVSMEETQPITAAAASWDLPATLADRLPEATPCVIRVRAVAAPLLWHDSARLTLMPPSRFVQLELQDPADEATVEAGAIITVRFSSAGVAASASLLVELAPIGLAALTGGVAGETDLAGAAVVLSGENAPFSPMLMGGTAGTALMEVPLSLPAGSYVLTASGISTSVARPGSVYSASISLRVQAPSLAFISPAPGTVLVAGGSLRVAWTSSAPGFAGGDVPLTVKLMSPGLTGAGSLVAVLLEDEPADAGDITVPLPDDLLAGDYVLWASAPDAPSLLVTSPPFRVRSPDPTLQVVQPTGSDSFPAGSTLPVWWNSGRIAADATLEVHLLFCAPPPEGDAFGSGLDSVSTRAAAGGCVEFSVASAVPNINVLPPWPIPLLPGSPSEDDVWPAGRWAVVRVAPTVPAQTATGAPLVAFSEPFAITQVPLATTITVSLSAPAAGRTLDVATTPISIFWTRLGANTLYEVQLWQSRFYFNGGDQLLATLSGPVPIKPLSGSVGLIASLPPNLPSTQPVYIRVRATNGPYAGSWGRSQTFAVKAAPLPGLADTLRAACGTSDASVDALARAQQAEALQFSNSRKFWRAMCSTTCAACTGKGGLWLADASLALTFAAVASAAGTDAALATLTLDELRRLSSELGAFSQSAPVCIPDDLRTLTRAQPWPPGALANASDPSYAAAQAAGGMVLELGFLPHINSTLGTLSRALTTAVLRPRLSVIPGTRPVSSCSELKPLVEANVVVQVPSSSANTTQQALGDAAGYISGSSSSGTNGITVSLQASSGASSASSSSNPRTTGRRRRLSLAPATRSKHHLPTAAAAGDAAGARAPHALPFAFGPFVTTTVWAPEESGNGTASGARALAAASAAAAEPVSLRFKISVPVRNDVQASALQALLESSTARTLLEQAAAGTLSAYIRSNTGAGSGRRAQGAGGSGSSPSAVSVTIASTRSVPVAALMSYEAGASEPAPLYPVDSQETRPLAGQGDAALQSDQYADESSILFRAKAALRKVNARLVAIAGRLKLAFKAVAAKLGLTPGELAGAIVGGVIAALLLVGAAMWWRHTRMRAAGKSIEEIYPRKVLQLSASGRRLILGSGGGAPGAPGAPNRFQSFMQTQVVSFRGRAPAAVVAAAESGTSAHRNPLMVAGRAIPGSAPPVIVDSAVLSQPTSAERRRSFAGALGRGGGAGARASVTSPDVLAAALEIAQAAQASQAAASLAHAPVPAPTESDSDEEAADAPGAAAADRRSRVISQAYYGGVPVYSMPAHAPAYAVPAHPPAYAAGGGPYAAPVAYMPSPVVYTVASQAPTHEL